MFDVSGAGEVFIVVLRDTAYDGWLEAGHKVPMLRYAGWVQEARCAVAQGLETEDLSWCLMTPLWTRCCFVYWL